MKSLLVRVSSKWFSPVPFIVLGIALSGCNDDDDDGPPRDAAVSDAFVPDAFVPDAFVPDAFVPDAFAPDDAEPPGEPSFAADVHPILMAQCSTCHTPAFAGFPLEDDPDVDHAAVLPHLDLDNPEDSHLLLKGTAAVTHGGGQALDPDSAAYDLIVAWIEAGAPNAP
jgi:mono/diheme cytochrome c family protein